MTAALRFEPPATRAPSPATLTLSSNPAPEPGRTAVDPDVQPVAPGPAPVRHLLVIEDDPRVGSFIAQGLRDEGYDVLWTLSAEDALVRAGVDPFDLILLDHMLPGRSGIQVARTLRASGNKTPILMLTARDAPEDRKLAFAAGANEFMAKPFLFDDLLARIHLLLAA